MVVDPIGLVGGARGYFVFGKRVCELEAFVGTTGGMGGNGVYRVNRARGVGGFHWVDRVGLVDLIGLVGWWLTP